MSRFCIVVLISGRGSNLDSLIRFSRQGHYEIAAVISNRPRAPGLEIAQQAGLKVETLDHTDFSHREEFDAQLEKVIERYQPDLVVLAGFMRILGTSFVSRFQGKLINIHPSLLPHFPGTHTHERALDAGVQWHGASVHFVNAEVDGGPVIAQVKLEVRPQDDATTLAERLLPLEHQLLPRVVALLAEGKIRYAQNKVHWDDAPHTSPPVLDVATGRWQTSPGIP